MYLLQSSPSLFMIPRRNNGMQTWPQATSHPVFMPSNVSLMLLPSKVAISPSFWCCASHVACFGQWEIKKETWLAVYKVPVHLGFLACCSGTLQPREQMQVACWMTRHTSRSCSTGHCSSQHTSRRHLIRSSSLQPRSVEPCSVEQNGWPKTNTNGCCLSHYILGDLLQQPLTADGTILCKY